MTNQSRSDQLTRASNEVLEATSFLSGANAPYMEALYAEWLENPDSVEPSWAAWFAELGHKGLTPAHLVKCPEYCRDGVAGEDAELIGALTGLWPPRKGEVLATDARTAAKDSVRAIHMVRAYRVIGHLAADLDPLHLNPRPQLAQLDPNFYGFHDSDLDRPIFIDGVLGLVLREAVTNLIRHSAASHCAITIETGPEETLLKLQNLMTRVTAKR